MTFFGRKKGGTDFFGGKRGGKYFFDKKIVMVIFIKSQFFGQEIAIVEKGRCQVFVGV